MSKNVVFRTKIYLTAPKQSYFTPKKNPNPSFSNVNALICEKVQTNTMTHSRDKCKWPYYGPENDPIYPKVNFWWKIYSSNVF